MASVYNTSHRFFPSASLALSMLLVSSVASAQPADVIVQAARMLEGTAFVVPMNQSREGTIDTCGFEFKAMAFDTAYKQGAPIVVNGSFAIRKLSAQLVVFAYKLGTFNVTSSGMEVEAPHFAWMKLGNVLVKPAQAMDAETKGYRLYLSPLPENADAALDAVVEQKPVLVGFNRRPGGLDVVVPLDLSVRDTKMGSKVVRVRDDKLGKGFAQCLGDLFAGIKLEK